MTARIDLDELEQRARSIQTIFAGCEINGHIRAHAEDVLALIAAVRALRSADNLIADMLPHSMQTWACKGRLYWNEEHAKVRAALAAFDFKEETK